MGRQVLHIAEEQDAGKRLDTLARGIEAFGSRSAFSNAIEAGAVVVNGVSQPKKYLVKTGEAIVFTLPDDAPTVMSGQDIPLDIRYEDDDLIVLSKQIGLVCHPSADHFDGTLVNALIYHCGAANLCNVQGEDDRLGIVHRLDMDTSGLMLVGKSNEAGAALMEAIRNRDVDRHYLALVHGIIAYDNGMIDAPITRSSHDRTKMAVRDTLQSRDALTSFEVLERFAHTRHDDGYTLIDCKLFTGRTHQIRVHLEYAKHPLAGEQVYTAGAPKDDRARLGLQRQFLHSYRLAFEHPTAHEPLEFADNLPGDLHEALASLSERSLGTTARGNAMRELLATAPHPAIEGEPSH